jgi:hypothetical protein
MREYKVIYNTMNYIFNLMYSLHNEELHNLYSSPSIIRMIKSRRMRWAGHEARIGGKRNAYRILVGDRRKETTRKTKT